MSLSKERINEFKEVFKKDYGKDLTDAEASEYANSLMNFVELLYDCALKDVQKKNRLKKEPNGFPVDGNYSCLVCGCSINSENGWYDWYGHTCLLCRDAIKNGTLPAFVCQQRDSYYLTWHLKDRFKIHPATARKMVREGKLKARIVLNENNKPYEYVFLKKENPGLVDPERYTSGRKSYNRHREKEDVRKIREYKKETKSKFKSTV